MSPCKENDKRVVMTLDAGGTNFVFGAMCDCKPLTAEIRLPSSGNDLGKSLNTLFEGFHSIRKALNEIPQAISIAFPGPCDYVEGIVFKQKNLPAYQNGVPLKYLLEKEFKIPVFMHNDADLFAYGEAQRGLLPKVNNTLSANGTSRAYENLLGVTIGTGFGAGIVSEGRLFKGDNSSAAEVWALRNKKFPYSYTETTISAQGLVNTYKRFANISAEKNLSAGDVSEIALGNIKGNQEAALATFNEFGEVLGNALVDISTIVDGLIVIGGGLSNAYDLFIRSLINEMNSKIKTQEGIPINRLTYSMHNLENPKEYAEFCSKSEQLIQVPFSDEKISYYGVQKIGVGKSFYETSHSVAIGAYLLAVKKLNI